MGAYNKMIFSTIDNLALTNHAPHFPNKLIPKECPITSGNEVYLFF